MYARVSVVVEAHVWVVMSSFMTSQEEFLGRIPEHRFSEFVNPEVRESFYFNFE